MTELRKASRQALEAFESGLASERADAMKALRQAIEQAEKQEPLVYRLHETDIYEFAGWLTTRPGIMEVGATSEAGPMAEAVGEYLRSFPEKFTAAARRQRLTDEDIEDAWECVTGHNISFGYRKGARTMYISPDEVIEFARTLIAKATGEKK
jgi:hypothetical protein